MKFDVLAYEGGLLARLHEKKRVQYVLYEGFSEMVIVSEMNPSWHLHRMVHVSAAYGESRGS